MNIYQGYFTKINAYLQQLSENQLIAYGLITAKRFYNFYAVFSQKENFSNVTVLQEVQKKAYDYLLSKDYDTVIVEDLKNTVKQVIPDSDDFDDCSDAQSAAFIHYYLIEYILTKDIKSIENIANCVYEFRDRHAQETLSFVSYTKDIEDVIEKNILSKDNIDNEFQLLEKISKRNKEKCDLEIFIERETNGDNDHHRWIILADSATLYDELLHLCEKLNSENYADIFEQGHKIITTHKINGVDKKIMYDAVRKLYELYNNKKGAEDLVWDWLDCLTGRYSGKNIL